MRHPSCSVLEPARRVPFSSSIGLARMGPRMPSGLCQNSDNDAKSSTLWGRDEALAESGGEPRDTRSRRCDAPWSEI